VFAIGGDLPVVRLGYGAMQIPGPGVWGEPRDHDEVIRVLRRALEQGTFIDVTQIATVQNRYDLSDRGAEPVLDYCQREGIGFSPWFPMATGHLARPRGPLQQIANEHAVTPAQPARMAAAALTRSDADPRHIDGRAPRRECRCGTHRAHARPDPSARHRDLMATHVRAPRRLTHE
jgi:aryl-alcohol dehydrogenase-like predicted oxidoreductase